MPAPKEQCRGELTLRAKDGRQPGDRCIMKNRVLRNHLCHFHQTQHNNPIYPTPNSYRHRSDAGASTPVDTPSSTTASAGPNQSSSPQQQPTSSNPQPETPPEQSDRRGAPRRMSLHTNTPTQASSAASAPSRSPRSNNLPTPPSSARDQNDTPAPNPSHSTSRPNHDDTFRATSSNSEDSGNHHHSSRPPSHTPENQAGASSQPSESTSRHTHLYASSNTPRPTTIPSTVSAIIDYFNSLRSDLSYRSDRSRRRAMTIQLYYILHRLQLDGKCPNAEPLGPNWIDIDPTSVPSIPPEPEGGLTILDMIVDMLDVYKESKTLDANEWQRIALELLRLGCDENELGAEFRHWLRQCFEGSRHGPMFGQKMRSFREKVLG